MTHSHTISPYDSANRNHYHYVFLNLTNCGNPAKETHQHQLTLFVAQNHLHTLTVTIGTSALGSPWWNHTHTVTLSSMTSTGGAHTHVGVVELGGCLYLVCGANSHVHTTTNPSGSGGTNHTHSYSSVTGTADPLGTPESHTHTIPYGATGNADNHRHLISGITINNALCFYSYNHTHTKPSTVSNYTQHAHGVPNYDVDFGGEPAPAAPQGFGDGLIFVS